jgi:membrane protease YdiL (CAAX protease family)
MGISSVRKHIRSIALSIVFSGIGFAVVFILKKLLHVDLSKLEFSIVAFLITSLSVLLLFPKVFKIPFGRVSIGDFLTNAGLSKPPKPYRFLLLGIMAALFTLSGMLLGSILTGKFTFSFTTITLTQAVFSLTPGIWEEVLFRGVIIIVLLKLTKSYKKAFIIQIVIFGLAHIKGIDLLSLVDAFSVMILAVAFTYSAYKTKSLIPGIIFHYLHDTFLFFVQLPDGEYSGFHDNVLFFGALWIATALAVACIKRLSEKYSIINAYDFYALNSGIEEE